MAVQYFDQLLSQGLRAGQIPNKNKDSRDWYREAASKVVGINDANLFKGVGTTLTTNVLPGNMYMFYYDPKYKATLPYYDMFPLIFPINRKPGGFLGLNMHYLPLNLRAKLMDALYTQTNNKKFDETTRLKINYDILQRTSSMQYYKPCIKQYLNNHVRSRFILVNPSEWDIALFLPTARWAGAKQSQIWSDSKRKLRA